MIDKDKHNRSEYYQLPRRGLFFRAWSRKKRSLLACDFSACWAETQKRTAEYPPALRTALPRNGSRDSRKHSASI